jgi:hypothetical protein
MSLWVAAIVVVVVLWVNEHARREERDHHELRWKQICLAIKELGWDEDRFVTKLHEIAERQPKPYISTDDFGRD